MNVSASKEREKQIKAWKEEFVKIFSSSVAGKEYIWRRVKRKEYSEIMADKNGESVDERIYNRQLAIARATILNLTDEEKETELEELAGLAITIAEEVMEKSGFNLAETTEL